MILLGEFNVLRPDVGLIFWSTIFFLLFWFLIGKLAFKPIAEALKKREGDIQDALDQAAEAKKEMSNLKAQNDQILAEAREARTAMLKEGKEMRDSMIAEAKDEAKVAAHATNWSSAKTADEEMSRTERPGTKRNMFKYAWTPAEWTATKDAHSTWGSASFTVS